MESPSSCKMPSKVITGIDSKPPSLASQSQIDHEKQGKQCAQALQPHKDHEKKAEECAQGKPEWIERFMGRTFFDTCSEHPFHRNELNKYCIDCDAAVCQYCLMSPSHADHRLLKIYRHVYKEVVLVDEIKKHMDCSLIQQYRCNKQMVVSLAPLPHTGSKTNEEETCQTCKRKLMECDIYSYCSISCKMEALTKENESALPLPTADQPEQKAKEETRISFRRRKRKGTPHRAPFF